MQSSQENRSGYYFDYLLHTEKVPQKWYHRAKIEVVSQLMSSLPKGARVLDAGCGSGYITGRFSDEYEIYGIDCEREGIEFCKTHFPKGTYSVENIYSLSFPDNYFDLVVFNDAIEHLFEPHKSIAELARVMKLGSVIEICTVNYDSWLWLFLENTWYRVMGGNCKPYDRNVHPSRLTPKSLRQLIERYLSVDRMFTKNAGMEMFILGIKTACGNGGRDHVRS